MTRLFYILTFFVSSFYLTAQNTVVNIIADSPDHNTLEVAVTEAGLVDALNGAGPFTVFAPTDAAFNLIPTAALNELLADPTGNLQKILLQHVVSGDIRSTSLSDGQVATTLLGQNVSVSINMMNEVFIDGAKVTVRDLVADNGVVHVIDAVLSPPSANVAEVVINSPVHNTLETAVIEAGLAGTLQGDGPFTVFAPTDAAFDALPAGTVATLLQDPTGDLAKILLQHVLSGEILSSDLSDGQAARTLLGQGIEVTINSDGVFIDDAKVSIANIRTFNGVVHVLDAVLTPPSANVAEVVINSPVHNTLETAVVEAGLAGALQGDGPFTVFAPTDAAFDALPAGTVATLLQDPTGDLARILLQHVVSGEVLSTDLSDGQRARTLLGQGIEVTINNDGVFIDDAKVSVTDIRTFNGVVHVLDAVLTPPSANVAEVVINSPDHTTLETAVVEAGLAGALQGDGPFTVFAPTDAAFDALPAGTVATLLQDPTGDLARILLQHVLAGEVLSTDLSDGQTARTLLGQGIEVTINNDGVFIDDAKVSVTDIRTFNGVVHVLDAVLLPGAATVADVVINSDVHNTLETAVSEANLVDVLKGDGPFTVFAPTDAAFDALPAGTLDALLADPDGDLTKVLQYHVLSGEVLSTDLSDGQTATTLLGQDITVAIDANGVMINDAMVTVADVRTYNGVVHVIDAVLLPNLTTSIKGLEEVAISVAPNPSTDFAQLTIPAELLNEELQAQLISTDGKVMRTWSPQRQNEIIEVNNLPSGVYVLLLTSEKSFARNTLIVK